MKLSTVRRQALTLPGTSEVPHFDRTSFRVGKKIFATAPEDGLTLNIFLDEAEREVALALHRQFIEALWWGEKVRGVTISLVNADKSVVEQLLTQAWRRCVTKRVVSRGEL